MPFEKVKAKQWADPGTLQNTQPELAVTSAWSGQGTPGASKIG